MTNQFTAHGQPPRKTPRPPRAVCERIGHEIATGHGMSFEALLYGQYAEAKAARYETWLEIVGATGCSLQGLADAWGVDRCTIVDGLAWARRQVQLVRAA